MAEAREAPSLELLFVVSRWSDMPRTPRQWRLRRQMQDRYLMARSRTGRPVLLPNGMRLARVFPEWVSEWPLWESCTDH